MTITFRDTCALAALCLFVAMIGMWAGLITMVHEAPVSVDPQSTPLSLPLRSLAKVA